MCLGEKNVHALKLEKTKVEMFSLQTFNLLCGTSAMI